MGHEEFVLKFHHCFQSTNKKPAPCQGKQLSPSQQKAFASWSYLGLNYSSPLDESKLRT